MEVCPISAHLDHENANGLQLEQALEMIGAVAALLIRAVINMILTPFQMNRRTRRYIHRVAGAVALFCWLFVSAAEYFPHIHAWLHGGTIPDDDDCAVVMLAAGHADMAALEVQLAEPVIYIEITPRVEIAVFVPVEKILPNERAPPLACA